MITAQKHSRSGSDLRPPAHSRARTRRIAIEIGIASGIVIVSLAAPACDLQLQNGLYTCAPNQPDTCPTGMVCADRGEGHGYRCYTAESIADAAVADSAVDGTASVCGNGIAEADEMCDQQDFKQTTCQNIGYTGGTLSCSANCTLVEEACEAICGDGVCNSDLPAENTKLETAQSCPVDCIGDWSKVAAGAQHTCAIENDNTLWCWGDNASGQVGRGEFGNAVVTPEQVGSDPNWKDVTCGEAHTCALTMSGAAYCWGKNDDGQLGTDDTVSFPAPQLVAGGLRFQKISAGGNHTCAWNSTDLQIYCWGSDAFGQLGDDLDERNQPAPVVVDLPGPTSWVSCGQAHTCAKLSETNADTNVYCWGKNASGQLGINSLLWTSPLPALVAVTSLAFDHVDCGSDHTLALSTQVGYGWGSNQFAQLGLGQQVDNPAPFVLDIGTETFFIVDGGDRVSCGISATLSVYCWGANDRGQLGCGEKCTDQAVKPEAQLVEDLPNVSTVSVGGNHVCAISNQLIHCWGANDNGQLGIAALGGDYDFPQPVEMGDSDP
jgi:alpha-tubulin suppressor-like RCC1 family protein